MRELRKEFFKYVSLNIMGMIGLSCYILADTYFVSNRLGADGLTALNLAIPVYSLLNGTGLMIGIGGATRYTICRSQKLEREGNQAFGSCLLLGGAAAVIFLAAGILGADAVSRILGAEGGILPLTSVYLRTLLCFAPFFLLNNIVIAFVRNDKAPKLAMAGMLTGSFSNIILDYVFMYPLGGGMFGAAFATGLAPIISLGVLSLHFLRGRNRFRPKKSRIRVRALADICSLGGAAFVNELSSGVVLVVFNLLILRLAGNVGVAAYGVVANLALVAVSVYTGTAQGSQPLISRYYGKGENTKVHRLYLYAAGTALVLSAVLVILIYGKTNFFVAAFNSEQNSQLDRLAFEGLRLYFPGFFFAGINIVTAAYLGAVEKARASFLTAMFRGTLGILVFALILGSIWGMRGVWLSYPVTEGVTLAGVFFLRNHLFREKAGNKN